MREGRRGRGVRCEKEGGGRVGETRQRNDKVTNRWTEESYWVFFNSKSASV